MIVILSKLTKSRHATRHKHVTERGIRVGREQTKNEQKEKADNAFLDDYNRSGTMGDQPQNSVRYPGWLSLARDRLAKASRVSTARVLRGRCRRCCADIARWDRGQLAGLMVHADVSEQQRELSPTACPG